MSILLLFSLVLFSLLCSAFFSGMEIAFISSNKLKIELDNNKGEIGAKILSYFSDKPAWFIATMLVGNNIALVIYTLYMAVLLDPYLMAAGLGSSSILLLQTIFSTIFILIFAEFLPKAIFRLNPNFILKLFSGILLVFYILLWPITSLVVYLTRVILRFFGKEDGSDEKVSFKKTDLDYLIIGNYIIQK